MSLPRITSVRAILRYPASLNSGVGVSATQSSGSVTFSLNIPGLTTDAAPTSDDYLITYDQAAGAPRKATIGSIITSSSVNFIDSRSYTVDHTINNDDAGRTIFLKGTAMGTLTFAAIAGYSATHANNIINGSTRRWSIAITGGTVQWLWPGQNMYVASNSGSAWGYSVPPLWRGVNSTAAVPTTVAFYVDPTLGNDANDGLTTGATGAVLKIQRAVDFAHYHVTVPTSINCASGTHTAPSASEDVVFRSGPSQGHTSNIITVYGDTSGSTTTRQAFIMSAPSGHSCINCEDFATLVVQGFTFRSAVNTGTLLVAQQLAILDVSDFEVGTATIHAQCLQQASIDLAVSAGIENIIRGSANIGMEVRRGGAISLGGNGTTYRLPTALSFTTFAVATDCGVFWNGTPTYTGTGSGAGSTGVKYAAALNGVLDTNSTIFPGASAGTTATGGQYG